MKKMLVEDGLTSGPGGLQRICSPSFLWHEDGPPDQPGNYVVRYDREVIMKRHGYRVVKFTVEYRDWDGTAWLPGTETPSDWPSAWRTHFGVAAAQLVSEVAG